MLPIIILLYLFIAPSAMAAPPHQEQQPVAIQADSMEYLQKANRIVFRGAVHATHKDMELWADAVTVHLEEGAAKESTTSPQGVRSIVAEGNVRIQTTQNRRGTARRATFDARTETVTLEGEPEVREDKNSIRGEVIILYLKEGKSEVRGSAKQRVEAIFLAPKTTPGLLEKTP